MALLVGSISQLMSLFGSRPTYAANIETKMWAGSRRDVIGTVLPFRSRVELTRSLPSNSMQPMWLPASHTSGAPASISIRAVGRKDSEMSITPERRFFSAQ